MSIEVTAVRSSRELAAFVRVPALLHRRSRWTPASETWTRALLSRRGNPYYRHAERQLLLARKDGRLAGRVAAHVDHLCNRHLQESSGTFGFLDCEPHPRLVAALLDNAERWLASRGATLVRGPLGPMMRESAGLLVAGHGEMPTPGLDANPPELPPLVERAGYAPARDLHAYRVEVGGLPRAAAAAADEARRTAGLQVRAIRRKRLAEELPKVLEVLNDLPRHGRACAPWSEEELAWTVTRLRPIIDPGLVLLLEVDGVAAGLGFAQRNVREALGGRGSSKAMLDAARVATAMRLRRIRSARVTVLAVRAGFLSVGRGGLPALLLAELLGRLRLYGVEWAEVSLVDPTDEPLTSLLSSAGGRVTKTYRVYEKLLETSDPTVSRPPSL